MTVDFWHLRRETTSDLEIITKHEGLPIIIFAINCFDAHQSQFMRAGMHAFALEFMNQIAILEKMNANYESKVVSRREKSDCRVCSPETELFPWV